MIVTCPACDTRYLVDDDVLGGPEGRRVRCASCGNVWHYSPEDAAIHAAIAEVTAAAEAAAAEAAPAPSAAATLPSNAAPAAQTLRAEPEAEGSAAPAGPAAMPRPSVVVELPAAARRRKARLGGLALIALAVFVVIAALVARRPIMSIWPEAAPVYAALHLTEPLGAGLEVTVKPTRTSDSLVIDGDIVNSAQVAHAVPRLRVTLRDGNRTDLDSQVIDPPVGTLAPGGKAHFDTVFKHPSITATGVVVTFTQ